MACGHSLVAHGDDHAGCERCDCVAGLPDGLAWTVINGRWSLILPRHRAERAQWPWWEATRLAAMRHHIAPGDLMFDIGSEEADFPALWASWGVDVVLVEPNPRVWPNAKLIFEANELTTRIRGSFVGFAGAEERGCPAWVEEHVTGGESPWPTCATGDVISDHGFLSLAERPDCPVTTIDHLAACHGSPTVITMDIEGAELEALHGARQVLTDARPKLFVSVHPEFMRDSFHTDPTELYEYMDSLGYERVFLTADHERHEMFLPR